MWFQCQEICYQVTDILRSDAQHLFRSAGNLGTARLKRNHQQTNLREGNDLIVLTANIQIDCVWLELCSLSVVFFNSSTQFLKADRVVMEIRQMETPSSCNHSVMDSLAKELGFPLSKHKSHWCLAVEVPSGNLLSFHFFCLFEKVMSECVWADALLLRHFVGGSNSAIQYYWERRCWNYFFQKSFPLIYRNHISVFIYLSFCPFLFFQYFYFVCFQVMWCVIELLFSLFFV